MDPDALPTHGHHCLPQTHGLAEQLSKVVLVSNVATGSKAKWSGVRSSPPNNQNRLTFRVVTSDSLRQHEAGKLLSEPIRDDSIRDQVHPC